MTENLLIWTRNSLHPSCLLFSLFYCRRRISGAEEIEEEVSKVPESHESKIIRLRIASLFFDTIPKYMLVSILILSFSLTQLKSSKKLRKQCSFTITINKEMYLKLFYRFGRATDLSKLAIPPDDVFDYYCQCIRHQDAKNHTISRDSLQLRWTQLSDSQKKVVDREFTLSIELRVETR